MGEQVLYLPSSNSAEQSCHQSLKGVIKAEAKPFSGHSFGSFSLINLSELPGPVQPHAVLPAPGAGCLAALGDCVGTRWQLELCTAPRERPWPLGSSGGRERFYSAVLLLGWADRPALSWSRAGGEQPGRMPFPGGSGHTQPVPAPRSEHMLHLHIRQARSDPAAPEAGVPHPADCSSLLLPAERARALPGCAQLSAAESFESCCSGAAFYWQEGREGEDQSLKFDTSVGSWAWKRRAWTQQWVWGTDQLNALPLRDSY